MGSFALEVNALTTRPVRRSHLTRLQSLDPLHSKCMSLSLDHCRSSTNVRPLHHQHIPVTPSSNFVQCRAAQHSNFTTIQHSTPCNNRTSIRSTGLYTALNNVPYYSPGQKYHAKVYSLKFTRLTYTCFCFPWTVLTKHTHKRKATESQLKFSYQTFLVELQLQISIQIFTP